MELLFLIGLMYATSRAVEALRQPAKDGWAKHKAARAGTSPAIRAKRRSARMAVAGFWAGEVARGLPHARHGWAQGWAEHREAVTQRERERAQAALVRERDAAAQDADDAGWWARTRAEMAAHKHRLDVARQHAARPPNMSEQLATERGAGQRWRWYPDDDPYNPGGSQNGGHPMRSQDCTDPDCPCHDNDPPIPGTDNVSVNHKLQEAWDKGGKTPVDNGMSDRDGIGNPDGSGSPDGNHAPRPGGNPVSDNGSGGDFNYDGVVQLCDELIAAAEQAANDPSYAKAQSLADELGAMLNNDSGALGLAADVARDTQTGRDAATKLQEDAQAMKDHIVTNYGPVKEAVDASAGDAPEPEFVNS